MPAWSGLLVNYWYAPSVGHAVEGIRLCAGYRAGNPSLRIGLLLNAATATELATWSDVVDKQYAVPFIGFLDDESDPVNALAGVPREWDYVAVNHRVADPGHDRFLGFRKLHDAAALHLDAKIGWGLAGRPAAVNGEMPQYVRNEQVRLRLPSHATEAAARLVGARPTIAVMPAGGSSPREFYPSLASWEMILSAVASRHADARFCLIGKLARDERSRSAFTRAEVDWLCDRFPGSIDCFDRPIAEQLAMIEASDVLIAPHMGFAFAALAVGTPWLAVSGGQWHEYFFNGVPFHSVLPDTKRFPCFAWGGAIAPVVDEPDGEGPRTPSMSRARLHEDLDELLDATDRLIGGEVMYEQALADYFPRLLDAYGGDRSRVFSFDSIDREYLPS